MVKKLCNLWNIKNSCSGATATQMARPATETTGAIFQIDSSKICHNSYFFINDNIKVLENIKQVFKRTISWNKYRSEVTTQPKNNNLDYMIHSTFGNINRLFVPSFKNNDYHQVRLCFD